MKILMLTSTYEPLTGGAETYARFLCEGLVARGHDVVIATDGSWLDGFPLTSHEPGGRVLRLRTFAGRVDARDKVKWRQMQYSVLDELGDVLDGETFDVVHANSHETLTLASMVALDIDAALVCSLHEQNPDLERYGRGRCRLSYQVLPVGMYFAASRFYADRAVRFGVPADRLSLVYHGVPPIPVDARSRAAVRGWLGLSEGQRLVVLPGRVYTRKAQLDLAAALPSVVSRCPDVRVLLAGRVSDFDYEKRMWELLRELGVADRVTLRQDLGAADMPGVYAAADLVVQPSLEEGLGLALIEAMSAGRPVVGTRVVGISEVITHGVNGLLVPPSDPPRLAEAMVEVLTDRRLAASLASGARARAEERFSQDRMVTDTLAGYHSAIAYQRSHTAGGTGT
ncbi:glycosyltransferase family 4 protein [Streptomyces barkulensis]|uniref:glycosyltransferase family 4 protein n=1 Tax=Streptomyces barkulensis TaxID=1257026 RepID=UPI000C6E1BB7|nr:glycosyltransferase family 4 protein [Streptomyces barkulensis]